MNLSGAGLVSSYRIDAVKLDTGERRVLMESGRDPHYVPASPDSLEAGYLIFLRADALLAAPFDAARL